MPHTLQIEAHCAAQPLWTWVDRSELEAALLNLLINARDATAGSGRVTLHAEEAVLAVNAASTLQLAPRQVRPH